MLDFLSSLGLITWDFDPAIFRTSGGFELRYYGVLFALALAFGYMIIRWRYKDEREDPEKATNLTYALMIAIIVGTRLVHCLFYDFDRYMANPIEILYFWKGGLASHGAAIGIIVTCVVYDYVWRKTPLRITVDRLAYAIPPAMVCVRLGNFFNSEIVGAPCDKDFPLAFIFSRYDMAMGLPPTPRYPSQLFEASMGIIAAIVMYGTYFYFKKRNKKVPLGMPTALILLSYFSMRFFVEFFKEYQIVEDGILRNSGLREGQLLSIPFILIALGMLAMCIWGPWKNQHAEMYNQKYWVKKDDESEDKSNNSDDKSEDEKSTQTA